jgi:probable HAF family extracellular repeat protein
VCVQGASRTQAVLWDRENGLQDLGTLGGEDAGAADINERGQVVGTLIKANGHTMAFLWHASAAGVQELGTLGGTSALRTALIIAVR